ncbi:hypothetical protein DRN69_06385 [Candidatus Pacearchaeota archaeon]|nr:MAG: hypothetical protein DRN69_06385 [Candidatus Pacearchaeota archaeon]
MDWDEVIENKIPDEDRIHNYEPVYDKDDPTVLNADWVMRVLDKIIDGKYFIRLPVWTIATRPQNPLKGMIGFNEELGHLEFYNGSDWIPLGV